MNIKSFFLENIGIKQTILKNTFWLAAAEGTIQILKLALIVYTARVLGAEEYGKFSFALSFVCLVVVLAEFGLPDIITREFSKNKEAEKEYPAIVSLKIFLSLGTFLLMCISSFFITQDPAIQKSIWLLGLFILITSFLNIFYAFFRARQKMEYESFFKILQYVFLSLISFVILFTIPSIENLSLGYLLANISILCLALLFFKIFIKPIPFTYDKQVWRKFLYFSWPLAFGLVIGWIYVPVSSVMLGYFGYHMENGWYSAAFKIVGALVLSATLISRSFFPALSLASRGSKGEIQKVWNYQNQLMVTFAIPLMVGGIMLASNIVVLFYGHDFVPSIFVFQWLSVIFSIDFLYYPYASALVIFGLEKLNFFLISIGLAMNIMLTALLLPAYGLNGVVLANLASSMTVLFLAAWMVARHTPIFPFNRLLVKNILVVAISSLMMFLVIKFLLGNGVHVAILIIAGMLAYFAVFGFCYWLINKGRYHG